MRETYIPTIRVRGIRNGMEPERFHVEKIETAYGGGQIITHLSTHQSLREAQEERDLQIVAQTKTVTIYG